MAKDAAIIHANGMICRESYALNDHPNHFYMLGSMGLASSIGLGIAICHPTLKVVILDGDGNLLMNLGILAMIGHQSPSNLIHVVLDNEMYASTGEQKTISAKTDLALIAKSAGYAKTHKVDNTTKTREVFQSLIKSEGPSFMLVKIASGDKMNTPRIKLTPSIISNRFKNHLEKTN